MWNDVFKEIYIIMFYLILINEKKKWGYGCDYNIMILWIMLYGCKCV